MSFTEGPVHERSDAIVHEPAAVVDVPANGTVVTPVVAAPATAGSIRTAYNARFAPDSIIPASPAIRSSAWWPASPL